MHPSLYIAANSGYKQYFSYYSEANPLESNPYVPNNGKYYQSWLAWPNMPNHQPIEPHNHDVLLGRGGRNNQHSGNDILRQLGRLQGENYRVASKKGKSAISRLLVRQMRELDPPARFLKRVQQTATWEEVSDETAREKASQVLRDAVTGLLDKKGDCEGELASILPLSSVSAPVSADEHDLSTSPHCRKTQRQHFYPHIRPESGDTERKRQHYQAFEADIAYSSSRDVVGCSPLRRHTDQATPVEMSVDMIHNRSSRRRAYGQPKLSSSNNSGNHLGKLDEFALLHGELLDSDVEDESSTGICRDKMR